MKTLSQQPRTITIELTERELRVLRAVLSEASDTRTAQSAERHGVKDLHDDDLTDLYGGLGEALR